MFQSITQFGIRIWFAGQRNFPDNRVFTFAPQIISSWTRCLCNPKWLRRISLVAIKLSVELTFFYWLAYSMLRFSDVERQIVGTNTTPFGIFDRNPTTISSLSINRIIDLSHQIFPSTTKRLPVVLITFYMLIRPSGHNIHRGNLKLSSNYYASAPSYYDLCHPIFDAIYAARTVLFQFGIFQPSRSFIELSILRRVAWRYFLLNWLIRPFRGNPVEIFSVWYCYFYVYIHFSI